MSLNRKLTSSVNSFRGGDYSQPGFSYSFAVAPFKTSLSPLIGLFSRLSFPQTKVPSKEMLLSFLILFCWFWLSDHRFFFSPWVDNGEAMLTCLPSLKWERRALDRCLSFLSALFPEFLQNLVPSHWLTKWNISSIHVAQAQRDKDINGMRFS